MEKSIDVSRGVSIKLINGANKNMAVDGSVAPVVFEAIPPAGKKWRITRMIGYLEGANPFSAEKFGDLLELANGVEVRVSGVLLTTWNTNRNIASQIPNLTAPKALGKEDRTLAGAWNIKEAYGNAILVDSEQGGITFTINDNLSTLDAFFTTIEGQEV